VDAPELGARDRLDRSGEHAPERAVRERAELDRLGALGVERRGDRERIRLARAEARGREHADRLVVQPPEREPERARGRGVEPLEVVDGDDGRPLRGEPAQLREHCPAAGERVVVGAERVGVEASALEEVDEPDEREPHLLRRRPRDAHVVPGGAARLDRLQPERRLPDSRVAAQDQRARARRKLRDERAEARPLRVAADDGRHACGGRGVGVPHGSSIGSGRGSPRGRSASYEPAGLPASGFE
jgi:hypothetical protein